VHQVILNDSEQELVAALLQRQVRFLIVGGHAVHFHGHPRTVKDLDLFVEPVSENASGVVSALASVGVNSPDLTTQRLSLPNQQIRIGGHINTELLTSLVGVTFQEAYLSRVAGISGSGPVPFISKEHLLNNKRASARPQDIQDVEALSSPSTAA
jgi:predicted nucleotidyltransferase